MVIRVHHVQISVAPDKVDASRDFYVHVLGFNEIEDLFPTNGGLWLRGGEVELHIRPEPDIDRRKTKAHPAFQFDRLELIRQRLIDRKVAIEEQPDIPGLMRFHTFDPSGNRLELLQAI